MLPFVWDQWPQYFRDGSTILAATEAHLRTLMPEGQPFWRSLLTAPAVARWLATRTALVQKRRPKVPTSEPFNTRTVSGGTKRKYLAAVQSFARYLVEIGELSSNPLRDGHPHLRLAPAGSSSSYPMCSD